MKLRHWIMGAALCACAPLMAHEYYGKSLKVIHPWALPTEAGATSAAVYVRFEEISINDKLVSAHTNLAGRVELHAAREAGAAGAPKQLSAIDLPAGAIVDMEPGTAHLMLVDLKAPLQNQRSYTLTLNFEKSAPMQVVISIGAH